MTGPAMCGPASRRRGAEWGLILGAWLWAAVWLPIPARAACPAPQPGEALPIEAQANLPDDAPWRAKVAQLDQVLAQTDLPRVGVLFLGDSITEAWDPEIFTQNYGGLRPLNLGVRGDTTQGMLWRLRRIPLGTSLRPALIVLLIGTNDTWPGGDPRHAAIGVGTVVGALRRLAPASRILLVGILPRGPDGSDPWRRMGAAMNPLIAACADGKNIFFTDPGPRLLDPGGRLPPDLAADYLHPTPSGYAILAKALTPTIRGLLAER